MAKKSAAKNEEEILPDHLRCGRTDGKQWRCKRRVMDNLKLCEIHYLQGKHRQYKEKVPESLKLQRKRKNEEETVVIDNEDTTRAQSEFKMELRKNKKKKKLSEGSVSLTDSASVSASVPVRKKTMKQCDTQLELIRMVLEREVEKRKRNNNNNNKKKKKNKTKMKKKMKEIKVEEVELEDSVELRKELPNGVMKISPASITQRDDNNVSSHCDVKVGVDHHKVVAVTPRYFRSKNVDRVPLGKLQVCFLLLFYVSNLSFHCVFFFLLYINSLFRLCLMDQT